MSAPQKIVVCDLLGGGLGNQMFQWAFGLAVARKLGLPYEWSRKETAPRPGGPTHRNFDLSIFKLKNQPHFYPPTVYENMGCGNASDLDKACEAVVASEHPYCGIRGHFQHEDCFANVAEEVREAFKLEPLRIAPEDTTQVSVQVRRGDYVAQPLYAVCGERYFERAMVHTYLEVKNPHFVFVSDDLDWCQAKFGHHPNVSIPNPQTMEDSLRIMSGSEFHIISNSSFGAMGAWLQGGKTIVPSRWLNGSWRGHPWTAPSDNWIRVEP